MGLISRVSSRTYSFQKMLRFSSHRSLYSIPKPQLINPLQGKAADKHVQKQNMKNLKIGLPEGPNEDQKIGRKSFNTNPRNLEFLDIEKRDRGWGPNKIESFDTINGTKDFHYKSFTSYPQRDAYYLCHLDFTDNGITASIEYTKTQKLVLAASSKEWQIRRQLYSDNDITAAFNIGRVLADRALSAGINKVHLVHKSVYNRPNEEVKLAKETDNKFEPIHAHYKPDEKVKNFINGAMDIGLILHEQTNYTRKKSKDELLDEVFTDEI